MLGKNANPGQFCCLIFYIIISFIIALLLWILLIPVSLILSTDTNRYLVMLPGIVKMAAVPAEGLFKIRGWIFFIPFKFDPFRTKKTKKKKSREKPVKKRKSRKISGNVQMIIEAIRAIRIRKLLLDIDTDDFMLNAWLVPVFSYVNTEDIQMTANFEGRASLLLDLRVRLGTLLWIVIRNRYKSFIHL